LITVLSFLDDFPHAVETVVVDGSGKRQPGTSRWLCHNPVAHP
jgi:hypothetical protein